MSRPGPLSERAIILTPQGRDSQVASMILQQADFPALVVANLDQLCQELTMGAGLAIIADEALLNADLRALLSLLQNQPTWSDLPVVLLSHHGGQQHPATAQLGKLLGNVTFLERPFHPITLVSLVSTAVRGRRRQYEARARLEELGESEKRLQNALTAGRLGAWELDADTITLTFSETSKQHFGHCGSAPFALADLLDSTDVQDREIVQSALHQSLVDGRDFLVEFRTLWPDTSLHWVDLQARAVLDELGKVTGLVGVSSNITERKNAESRLQQLNENLEQQVEERTAQLRHNEEALRQSQKMEAVGQLTGGIAHDFNNMLTGIIGSLELLRRRIARGKTQDIESLIDLGVSSANRAAGLTHRLLAFSRRQSLDSKPVELNELVSSMEELLKRSLSESTRLHMHFEPQLWIAQADPNQLESALLNLVLNARDAMPEGGEVRITTHNEYLHADYTERYTDLQPGEYVVLSVSDTGSGMSESVIERAFDPFFTTKPIGQGTGLGLSMIYGFSKQSHGHVSIDSEIGRGTTVRLYLPRQDGVFAPRPTAAVNATRYASVGETVLIVEDDNAVRLLITEVLSELGYAFVEAGDGNAAVPILNSRQRIDLLISDVGLPGMNGRQLAEIARQVRPDLKVLFITGYAEHAAVRAGFLDTGMQMITKPFNLDVLTEKVREMIEA